MTIPYSHVATGYGHTHVWSADQQDLHSISVAEDAVESYIPSGIDVGIDFTRLRFPFFLRNVMRALCSVLKVVHFSLAKNKGLHVHDEHGWVEVPE